MIQLYVIDNIYTQYIEISTTVAFWKRRGALSLMHVHLGQRHRRLCYGACGICEALRYDDYGHWDTALCKDAARLYCALCGRVGCREAAPPRGQILLSEILCGWWWQSVRRTRLQRPPVAREAAQFSFGLHVWSRRGRRELGGTSKSRVTGLTSIKRL